MSPLSDLLDRLRRAVVPPGAPAAAAAVPEDRALARAREVAPIVAELAAIAAEAAAVEAAATAEAEAALARGSEAAARVVEDARGAADRVRATAAAERRAEIEAVIAARLERGRADAARLEQRAARRTPVVVAAVVERVRTAGGEPR